MNEILGETKRLAQNMIRFDDEASLRFTYTSEGDDTVMMMHHVMTTMTMIIAILIMTTTVTIMIIQIKIK